MMKLTRLSFEERMEREMQRREKLETPKWHLIYAGIFLALSLGFMTLVAMNVGDIVKQAITPAYIIPVLAFCFGFSYMQSGFDQVSECFYQKRVRKYRHIRRAAELESTESDNLSTYVPLSYGKLEQK
jgi:hypothetical protein